MTKAALFDEEGREIAAVLARSEISHPRPGWAERSMDETWTRAARAIRNVFTVANANSENVAAVGLTGAMVGVVAHLQAVMGLSERRASRRSKE
jgi:L-xylulokinase